MVSTTESSGKQSVQYRLLVPRLSLMMFLQFFIWGSWSVTLGLVMSQHNMSLLIGDAFSAGPIASILSPFVLGMLVDRFFASQKVMAVMHLAGAAILWFVPQALVAQNGALLIGLLFGYTLCYMPTLALTNNIAFHSLSDKDKTFPVVRVFGTIGWIVAGIFIGVTGISDTTGIFTLAAIISVILALYSLTLPNTPAPAKGLPVKVRDLFCADAFALLKVRHFFVFSLCATLISVPLGTYYAYTASFLADAGVGDVSTAMSFGQMSEIFFMLVIPFLFRRLGVKYMLLIGMCAWFVRYAFFALGISEGQIPAVSRHSAARRVLRLLLRGRLYLHRSYRRGKSKRSGAKHDRHVYLWDRDAAGLANFRRTLQPAGGGANRASGMDHILVDPGSSCRSHCRDFPFLFQV